MATVSSLLLQFLDDLRFSFRQDFSFELVDADGLRNAGGSHRVVAGEHDDADSKILQIANRAGCRGLQRISHAYGSYEFSIDGDTKSRGPRRAA